MLEGILGPQPFVQVTWAPEDSDSSYVVGVFVEMESGSYGLIEYMSEHEFFMDALVAAQDTRLPVRIDPSLYS